jgi:Gas vesicle synthesis protein GvpL/GvpF
VIGVPDDTATRGETYVYGVMRAAEAPAVRTPGVGAEPTPVRTVTSGGLSALVSDVEAGLVRATRADLERHLQVLQEAAAAATVVPLRFGTVMPGDETVQRDLLVAREADLERMLGELTGRVELSLKGTYEERVLAEVVRERRDIAQLRERVRGADEAATYYDRIRLGELVADAMAAKRDEDTERILAPLRPLAEDVRLGDLTHERSVLSAAFLVRRERIDEFDGAADEVARAHEGRIRFRYAGPLPPYSFVRSEEGAPWG